LFLGAQEKGEVDRVAEIGLGAVERLPGASLAPGEASALPRRAPRLLALGLRDAGRRAERLHVAAAEALAGAGLHEPEGRPFWPHVTLARVPGAAARTRPGAGRIELPPPPVGPIPARVVTLYRSRPSPHGARYEALASRRLP
jgi:2'-5' RNA ligase